LNISQRKVKNNIIELEERNETDRRSADPHADTDACGVWAVEAAAHDPVGVEEAEGAEISKREEKKRCSTEYAAGVTTIAVSIPVKNHVKKNPLPDGNPSKRIKEINLLPIV
jgi:hypothetical protein